MTITLTWKNYLLMKWDNARAGALETVYNVSTIILCAYILSALLGVDEEVYQHKFSQDHSWCVGNLASISMPYVVVLLFFKPNLA